MIKKILQAASNDEISDKLLESFSDVQKNFYLDKHRYSGLEAGHFVESVRRFLELKLFGNYTPLDKDLPHFNEVELQKYAQKSGNESYRILIPRALFSIYTLRNKRGIGHSSSTNASKIDTSYILSACKWVLAEIIRIESGANSKDCEQLILKIVDRDIPLVWKTDKFTAITDPALNTKQKCLIYLLDQDGISLDDLKNLLQYTNKSRLQIYVQGLKKSGDVHIFEDKLYLSPFGQKKAETILANKTGVLF